MKISISTTFICVASIAATLHIRVYAADIFRSEGADGTILYSSQPLDKSYRIYMRDDVQKGRPVRISQTKVSTSTRAGDSQIISLMERLAQKHEVDPVLVGAVMAVESNANPHAVSPKGAAGVMQLMPATAAMYGVTNLSDPAQNIEAGILHLKYLLKLHKGNLALTLAAYNAGEGAVAKNSHRIPPYRETMLYVPAVLARMQMARNLAAR
jgi:soluble lytic murein transglycosylase-like protein